jgi:hypothetical protein
VSWTSAKKSWKRYGQLQDEVRVLKEHSAGTNRAGPTSTASNSAATDDVVANSAEANDAETLQ